MAVGLKEMAQLATLDHYERPCAPRIVIEKRGKNWHFASPYRDEDADAWEALLFQSFGTRHGAVMNHFLDRLSKLLPENVWDEKRNAWFPNEEAFNAMVAMVHSMQPENEAQAAYAAQLVALHFSAMKVGEQCSHSYADDRSRAILAKTVRAYGDGLERMARLQGKIQPKQVNQTIQVVYVDQRDQRQQTLITGGQGPIGGQAHGTDGGALTPRPSLPGPDAGGDALPIARREESASVSLAWLRQRLRRAFGQA